MTSGVSNKLTPLCLKFFAVTTITEREHQAIKSVDHTHNHKNNGVMLPNLMELACQLHVALHRSNHKAGMAEGMPYPEKIKVDLGEFAKDIKTGKFCGNPKALIETLDRYSQRILNKIDKFHWTITADGQDYQTGHCGCAGVTSISKKPKQSCPHNRNHGLAKKGQTAAIPRNTRLEIGK